MTPSWRKPAGMGLILLIITLWATGVAALADQVARWPGLAQALFYCVAGIIWIAPLKPLLRWMELGRWRK